MRDESTIPSSLRLPRPGASLRGLACHALLAAVACALTLRWQRPALSRERPPAAAAKAVPAALRLPHVGGSAEAFSCAYWRARGVGEFSAADVAAALPRLRSSSGAFRHDEVDAACPRLVHNPVNGAAGLGHRAINMLVALHAALYYNATYAHTFAWGGGVHGDYLGWAERLGWDQFAVSVEGLARGTAPGALRAIKLPPAGPQPRTHETFERTWGFALRNSSLCGSSFEFPGDVWPYDVTTLVKPLLAHYFLRAASGAQAPMHTLQWEAADINIVVHVRKGDVENQPDGVPARVVSETLLPALRAAGGGLARRAHVHVFAEFSRGYTGAAFPALGALRGGANTSGADAVDATATTGVRVTFWERASEWDAFVHMAGADFLVISSSGFPKLASLVSVNPLTLSFPSSDHYKHAHADTAPCYYDGRCSFSARTRARAAAARLREAEACGLLDSRTAGSTAVRP
jgi:hypothetical protein